MNAQSLIRSLNIIGVVAGVWGLFFPFHYPVVITLCSLVPAAAILLMKSFKGQIRFETEEKTSKKPALTLAFAVPSAVLAWRALKDFHILEFGNVWLPAAAVCAFLSVMVWMYSSDVKKKPPYLLLVAFVGSMYSYGLVIETNCLTDRSEPKAYHARVLGKRINDSSKSHSYYIKVTPWGPRSEEQEISIRRRGYERIKVDDKITILMKEGALGIPWFVIRLGPERRPSG